MKELTHAWHQGEGNLRQAQEGGDASQGLGVRTRRFPNRKTQDHLILGKFNDFSLTRICLFFLYYSVFFFLAESSIPTCDFTTLCVSVLLLTDIWGVSSITGLL